MNENLKKMVSSCGADAWEITETSTRGWEFYFIRHDLDQNRVRQVTHTVVTLYCRNAEGTEIGSSTGEIAPTATKEEIETQLAALKQQAGFSRNPVYDLNEKKEEEADASFVRCSLKQTADDFLTLMTSLPESEEAWINSYEIFVEEKTVHYINSNGVDRTQTMPHSFLEVIMDARKNDQEVELYRSYTGGACDKNGIRNDLIRTLQMAKDRLRTVPTPRLMKAPVVFSTKEAVKFYDFVLANVSAAAKIAHVSTWEAGKTIVDEPQGDVLTLTTRRELNNASKNALFDAEGATIQDLVLIENNKVRHFWGSRQYAQYLGLGDSFRPGCYEVSGGTKKEAEIRNGDYLEPVEFSDFKVNAQTGDLFGEIRLAYWHHNSCVIPVSGGSLSGNVHLLMQRMLLSQEQTQYDSARIPALTRFEGVTVTGLADVSEGK
jgi:predicted Zn-dependent protease